MKDRKLNEAESLDLIATMIRQTRGRLTENNGRPFLVMGYTTVAVSLAVGFALTRTGDHRWNWLWFVILLVWFGYGGASGWFRASRGTRTYVDRAIGCVWGTLGAAGFIVTLLAFFRPIPVLFMIVLLMGARSMMTGLLLRFHPLTGTGASALLLSPFCVLLRGPETILLFAALFAVMMIVPGHLLSCRFRRSQKA